MTRTEDEPNYYNKNGMSPMEAFSNGLISKREYIGFIKGNIIKYVVRCESKGDPIGDIEKASNYLLELFYVMGADDLGMSVDGFKEISETLRDFGERNE